MFGGVRRDTLRDNTPTGVAQLNLGNKFCRLGRSRQRRAAKHETQHPDECWVEQRETQPMLNASF